ncbi:PucR family transcriptional regulator [Nocardia rhamnosiphila]
MTSAYSNANGPVDRAPAIRVLVVAVAVAADVHRDEIVRLMIDPMISEIDAIADDQRLVELLTVGAEAAVDANIQMLGHDIGAEWMATPGAIVEYARVVAQRGLPVAVLEQGSRLTRNVMLRWCLEQLGVLGNDPETVAEAAVDLMARLTTWTDELYRELLEVYEVAYKAWLRNRTAARSARIEDILAGRTVEASAVEATLDYRLQQWHLGAIAWTDQPSSEDDLARLDKAIAVLGKHLGCTSRPLFEPRDERTAWAWLPLGLRDRPDLPEITSAIDGWDDSVRVALGAVRKGRPGFIRTHQQAALAAVVARASQTPGLRVVPIEEVGAVALMCSDLGRARLWVRDVLGPLADDDPTFALHRETLRVFLASGGSYTSTAASLTMHKNSVMYRLRKIENLLGRSVRERRLDLENALLLCHWLGPAVLHPMTSND